MLTCSAYTYIFYMQIYICCPEKVNGWTPMRTDTNSSATGGPLPLRFSLACLLSLARVRSLSCFI